MTMIDTTQPAQDHSPYKPQRKMSATTISTSAMSVASSMQSGNCDLRPPIKQSNSLLEFIAKDVVASIINGTNDTDDLSEAEGSMCSKMSRLNLNLESIADMVLTQMEKQHKGSDYDLRTLLRQGLSADEDYNTENVDASAGVKDQSSTNFSNPSSTSKSSIAASSQVTSSTVSDISMITGGAKQSVDIFHPSFWDKATTRDASTNDGVGTRATSSTPSTNRTVHTFASSDLEQATMHTRASLQDFINKVNIGSSDSESVSSETSSVLSDITGLTGCFDDVSERRRQKITRAPKSQSKPPVVISKGSSTQSKGETASFTDSKGVPKKRVVANQGDLRRVSFGRVHVRHYERIMCDNPSSTNGPSVGIGWQYVNKRPKEIEEFETKRERRRKSEMILTRAQREKIIRSVGYTEKEIAAMVRELNKSRFQRRQTVNNLGAQKMEETVELAKRQVLKALFLKKKQLIFDPI